MPSQHLKFPRSECVIDYDENTEQIADGGDVSRLPRDRSKDHLLVPLGEAIRAARKDQELSQEALAHAAGIERAYIAHLEKGRRNISFLNLTKIAEALDIKLSDLLIQANY